MEQKIQSCWNLLKNFNDAKPPMIKFLTLGASAALKFLPFFLDVLFSDQMFLSGWNLEGVLVYITGILKGAI